MRTLSCLSARAVPSTQPLRSPQPQRRRPLVPQAAAQPAAGGEAARVGAASGAAGGWPRREQVDFVKGNSVLPYSHVTQRVLNNIITMEGARGFVTADGRISQQVEDLPEAGTVQLVLQDDPPLAKQVRNLQSAADNATRAKELQAEAFLDRLASAEAPGSQPRRLQRTPFAGADGQDYMQADAFVVAGDIAYLVEFKTVLGEAAVDDVEMKLVKIRGAVQRGRSPDLSAALQGVTHVKLFLCGEAVRPGLAVHELAKQAALVGASLVLPSGQALGLASEPVPAVRL